MAIKLEVKNLYKIFGDNPDRAFKYIEKGASKEVILEKTGLSLRVKNASLPIEEGEIFVIMGLSGSGKSTMVRLLNRLIEPTRGQVIIDGVDIAKISDSELREVRRNKISMVFQSFALMPHMTVLNNTAFGMELAGIALTERQEKASEALRQVGLENYSHAYPDELSGGMRQRVGLARALAINPDILLMDEAFSALDPLIRTEMQDERVKLQARQQRTIIFMTGCTPGWGCEAVINHQLEAFGLSKTVQHNQGNYSAMIADILTRFKQAKPILYYTLTPYWVSDVMKPGRDVAWLQVPLSSMPGEQKDIDTKLPNGANYGFPMNTLHIVANKAWAEKNPAAAKLFAEMQLPLSDINAENAAMHAGQSSEEAITGHVDGWIKAHQAEFDKWVSDAQAATQ